jgi:uncharacterized protein (TIGR03083 family)
MRSTPPPRASDDGAVTGSGARYLECRARFVALVDGVDDDVPVPATPGWTVGLLLAHVVGVATDLVAGRVQQWSQPAWTAAQVEARAGRAREQLLAEWDEHAAGAAAVLDDPPAFGLDPMFARVPLVDVVAHEHDVREAVGRDAPILDADWAVIGVQRRLWLDLQVAAIGLPPLRVLTDAGDDWVVGGAPPAATVRAPRQEVWRSTEGRRRRDVVRAFDWSTDPEPYLAAWLGPAFGWPDDAPGRAPHSTD